MMLFAVQGFSTSAKTVISDTVITGKVKSKIAADASISVFNTKVTTKHGVVYLAGTVNSETDADALIQIAQATDGVKDVGTKQLHVKDSKKPFTDTAVTSKIKGLYIREKLMGENVAPIAVHVETNNGVVYLSGTVDNKGQADNAVKLAKTVKGVKKVESRVEVQAAS